MKNSVEAFKTDIGDYKNVAPQHTRWSKQITGATEQFLVIAIHLKKYCL